MSRSFLLLAAVSILGFQSRPAMLEQAPRVIIEKQVDPGCGFSVSPESIAPQILGPESKGVPVRILAQPDSPVAITGIDFRHMVVTVGSSGYEQHGTGTNTIDVRNISDRLVTGVS